MAVAEQFREHIVECGFVIDPEGMHHEFTAGEHGQKVDFDGIPIEDQLFEEWVDSTAEKLDDLYPKIVVPRRELLLVSVANGTNRLVQPVAQTLCGGEANVVMTEKLDAKTVGLSVSSKEVIKALIESLKVKKAVILDDTGTTGSTTVTAFSALYELGVRDIEVLYAWQRKAHLERLIGLGVPHDSIIREPMPNYTPEQCLTRKLGFCARGWELVEHGAIK
jgi:hypothetical protein